MKDGVLWVGDVIKVLSKYGTAEGRRVSKGFHACISRERDVLLVLPVDGATARSLHTFAPDRMGVVWHADAGPATRLEHTMKFSQ